MQEQQSLDMQLWNAISISKYECSIDEMKRLVDAGATLTEYICGFTVFHVAALSNKYRTELGGYILKKKPVVIINNKSIPTVDTPIRHPDFAGLTLLQKTISDAVRHDSVCHDIVELLVQHGANIEILYDNKQGHTPLYMASVQGSIKTAEALVKGGAKLNVATDEGMTPLLAALTHGKYDVALMLLSAGAKLVATHNTTFIPLQISEESKASFKAFGSQLLLMAVQLNNAEVVEYCFDVARKMRIQLDTNLKDSNGVDVYTFCVLKHRNIEIFRQIVINESKEKLASFHPALGLGGLTAIHFAAAMGDKESIKYLVNEMNVSINALAQNETFHVTPLDAARHLLQPSNPDFVRFLENFGAISGVDKQKLTVLQAYNQKKGEALKQYATEIRKAADRELNSSESVSTSSSGSSPENSPKKSNREERSASYAANQHGTLFQHKESAVVPAKADKKVKSKKDCMIM